MQPIDTCNATHIDTYPPPTPHTHTHTSSYCILSLIFIFVPWVVVEVTVVVPFSVVLSSEVVGAAVEDGMVGGLASCMKFNFKEN